MHSTYSSKPSEHLCTILSRMKTHIVFRWVTCSVFLTGILGERPCSWTFPPELSSEVLSRLRLPPKSVLSGKVMEGKCLPSKDCLFYQKLDLWKNKNRIMSQALCDYREEDNEMNMYCCPDLSERHTAVPVSDLVANSTMRIVTPTAAALAFNDTLHPKRYLLPGPLDCGQEGTFRNRIINGEEAGLGTFPWIVLLGFVSKDFPGSGIQFLCGGSLVSNRYVLTAAHCVTEAKNVGLELKVVRLGEYDTDKPKDCVSLDNTEYCSADPLDIEIEDVVVHADYERSVRFEHDIALVRLARPIQFTEWIKPVCLPFGSAINGMNENYSAVVAGWGKLGFGRPHSKVLHKADVSFIDMEKCKQAYGRKFDINFSQQFCAAGESAEDACEGDSGGPLIIRGQFHGKPQSYVVGIVSFGPQKCGVSPQPGAYTWVPAYFKWILDHIKH